MPIYEDDLEEMCKKNREQGRLEFTTDLAHAVKNSDVIFIVVGTPSLPNGQADLSQVETVAKEIAKHMNGYKIIVDKSTVPVGTQKWVTQIKELDLKRIQDLAKGNVFIDSRNVFEYETMKKYVFEYYCIGRRDAEYYNDFLKEVALTID